MKAIALCPLLAFLSLYSISAFPVENQEDEDETLGAIQKEVRKYLIEHPTEDKSFMFGTVCTLESAPSFSDDEIDECFTCFTSDITSNDGIEKTKECISTYLPNIEKACQSEINAGNMVFECVLNFVKEKDPNEEIQNGVRKYLDDNPTEYPEFIIGSSCTIESGPDNEKTEECYECWPKHSLSTTGLKEAKACVASYLPNIGRACEVEIAKLSTNDYEQGQRVFQCFLNYVQEYDVPAGESEEVLGAIQKEVRKYLIEHPTEDKSFLLGTVCTLESAPSFPDDEIDECFTCWPSDITSNDGIEKTKECISTYLPNIEKACQSEIKAGSMVFECFLNFVKENDPNEEIQNGVRKYLDDNPTDYREFIIGSSCTIESGPDNEKTEECYECWPEDSLTKTGLKEAKACVAIYLPNIGRACEVEIGKLSTNDYEQGQRLFQCFLDYVQEYDVENFEYEL